MHDIQHIIVQAGGRGSRLRHHTWNKPKCLVSVNGKPILYHLFDKYPNCTFHIIGDYLFDQLENYLTVNTPSIKYHLYKSNVSGTTSGINLVTENINGSCLIVWGDLILNEQLSIDSDIPCLITTDKFTCRYTIKNNKIVEETSNTNGVAGLYYFPNVTYLSNIEDGQEFAEWYAKNITEFNTYQTDQLEELGDFSKIELKNDTDGFARFFNEVKISDSTVTKRAIDKDYEHLIRKEQVWYSDVSKLGFTRIPNILSTEPYTMSRIMGKHAYQMQDLTNREKRSIIADYLESLTSLHKTDTRPANLDDIVDTYISKTISRVFSVSKIIPNFNKEVITINGLKCKNIFANGYQIHDLLDTLNVEYFYPIHGDPTFSNSLVDDNLKVWYIDPRGYFGNSIVYGDKYYDFAKLYYSAVGNYDSFNRRKFKLYIDNDTVEILLPETNFENSAEEVFNNYLGKDLQRIKIIHGLLWLSLSGYVKDDIDSIIGSFYNGLYWLEKAL